MRSPTLALGALSGLLLAILVAQTVALRSAYGLLHNAQSQTKQAADGWEKSLGTVKEWQRAYESMKAANARNEALARSLLDDLQKARQK